MAADRATIKMMCQQYAYAQTIPDACQPYLGMMKGPLQFAWKFPGNECPPPAALPPFGHALAQYTSPVIGYELN